LNQPFKGEHTMKSNIQHLAFAAALLGAALTSHAQDFSLKSADVAAGQTIAQAFAFNGFGCIGNNVSPALSWANPPAGTKGFALTVHDPDAVTGGAGFWHWVVINLPAGVSGLQRGVGTADGKGLPETARQINTDFGAPGWGGPCPPAGDKPHRYVFTVYALKTEKLDLPAHATASLSGFMVNANAIGKASFTSLYGR
jgi:Raf kinase inhibitor-like YbhB/YbcL family protein